MEVLTHINKRLKARPKIQVPVKPILELYVQTESSYAMVSHGLINLHKCNTDPLPIPFQNFSIIYITMGFPRMTVAEQTDLVPLLLASLHGKPEVHQDKCVSKSLSSISSSYKSLSFQAVDSCRAPPRVDQNPR